MMYLLSKVVSCAFGHLRASRVQVVGWRDRAIAPLCLGDQVLCLLEDLGAITAAIGNWIDHGNGSLAVDDFGELALQMANLGAQQKDIEIAELLGDLSLLDGSNLVILTLGLGGLLHLAHDE